MAAVVSPDGTVIGYESVGAGRPLLLVHGSTGTRARWSSVRPPLARRYTVHAMDRRGRGLSTPDAGSYGLRREAEDVAAVAEAVGGEVYVVGHSYGALAVLEAALISPAFRRVVLYEPPLPSPGLSVFSPDGWARITTTSDPREILNTFYRETLHLPESAIEDLADREFPYLAGSIAHTAVRELTAVSAYRATERLADIGVVRAARHREPGVFARGHRGRRRPNPRRHDRRVARPGAPGNRPRPTTVCPGGG